MVMAVMDQMEKTNETRRDGLVEEPCLGFFGFGFGYGHDMTLADNTDRVRTGSGNKYKFRIFCLPLDHCVRFVVTVNLIVICDTLILSWWVFTNGVTD